MSHKRIFILFLILPAILFSISGCTHLQEAGITPPQPEKPQEQPEAQRPLTSAPESETPLPPPAPTGAIIVKLSFSEPPVLGKPVEVLTTFAVREGYKRDATNTVVEVFLDDGFELIDGDLKWKGDLLRGSPVEIKTAIKAVKAGDWKIEARAIAYNPEGKSYTHGHEAIYARVSEDSAEISDIPMRPEEIPSPEPAEPPPGYEDVTPETPSEPPETEPPAQDVEPVDIQK